MAEEKKQRIGELLLQQDVIEESDLQEALELQESSEKKLGEILLDMGAIGEGELVDLLSKQTGYPVVNLDSFPIQNRAVKTLDESQARRYSVLPLMIEGETLTVAMSDPLDLIALDDVEQLTEFEVEPVISRHSQLVDYIDMCYSEAERPGPKREVRIKSTGPTQGEDIQESLRRKKQKPAVRMVNKIITDALEKNAEHIHLNPRDCFTQVLLRIDGVSRHHTDLPARHHDAIVSRLKLMAERSSNGTPGQSHYQIIRVDYGDENVIFRLRETETRFGDKLTVKICRGKNYERGLIDLGLDMDDISNLECFLSAPRGLMVFSGPSGSGKTTSLYASLRFFADTPNTIITVENPIEYDLGFCTQLEVPGDSPEEKAGKIYEALKADPDILAVSDMGEPKVARAVLYAAATGSKVISTYYADNAVDTLYHLANTSGVDRFQLANSLIGVTAQRLVRLLDDNSKTKYNPTVRERERLGLSEGTTVYQANPPSDRTSGYSGRTGIFQLLPVTDELRLCILNDESYSTYQETAAELDPSTLREKGVQKLLAGSTSVEEVLRATFREDFVQSLSFGAE